jgi:hypothetical protein
LREGGAQALRAAQEEQEEVSVRLAAALAVACLALLSAGACCASAAEPWWHLGSGSRPTDLAPGSEGEIVLTAENVGNASTLVETPNGEKAVVRIVDTLPKGLRAVGIAGTQPARGGAITETVPLSCSPTGLSCETTVPVAPYDQIEVRIKVMVEPGARVCEQGSPTCERNEVSVTGGGAPSAQVSRPVAISEKPTPFGIEDYELSIEPEGGAAAVGSEPRAASHPYQVTGTIALNQGPDAAPLTSAPQAGPAALAKDIVAKLPPGLIADPSTIPRCLMWEFLLSDGSGTTPECSVQSVVGVASLTANEPGGLGTLTFAAPLFNIEPETGEPARFGFLLPLDDVPVVLDTGVRSSPGEDWGVDLSTTDLPQTVGLSSARVTFWGAPHRASHDDARGWPCLQAARGRTETAYETCVPYGEEAHPPAFVTLPTSCTGPLQSSVQADPSSAPGDFQTVLPIEPLQALSGCEKIPFTPAITTEPTTHSAASPSGLSLNLNFDSEGLTSAGALSAPEPRLAQSDLAKTVVTLPEGMTIDPSAGVGLGACTAAQYAEVTLSSAPGAGCPADSKLGTVEIETPLLLTAVYGSLYLAQPYENPFSEPGHPNGSLIAVYVIVRSRAERGILIKLAGKVTPNPVTGQLTITFEGDPQLPFEHFNFHFREGQQAPLITPATCGTYTTTASLTPYSAPETPLLDTASFQVTSGSEGSACPNGAPPFAPTIGAGTLTTRAGTFSPLYVELSRSDAMQYIASYSTVLPLGLTADLTGVPQCPQADIEAARGKTGTQEEQDPSCPEASLIGHSLVGTGVGAVLDYVPGKLYLSGPFRGDPLSVVSITSAVVGPFDLGTVVVRFGLHIDPYTAQVSVDPTGSEPIPTIIDGIVTHVRDIRVSIDRPDFTINPTGCAPRPIASALTSSLGQTAATSTPLEAEGCDELAFKPKFTASTSGKTSRAAGASLSVKLSMPGSLGQDANIKTVKVDLPKQLPSRLTTLQRACTDTQFQANPAGCPAASKIGYAKATTPILPVPLEGPAIFVSHGGEAFPSLILVLQGYGFTIDLVGSTYISPKGITSTTFKTVPDEPVGNFELTLPQGPYSALAANGSLCHATSTITIKKKVTVKIHGHKRKITRTVKKTIAGLTMPTLFVAQNGAKIKQSTPIRVSGCGKAKKTGKKAAGKRKKR